jgi:hypothetical protein
MNFSFSFDGLRILEYNDHIRIHENGFSEVFDMDYLSVKEIANKWHVSARWVLMLCKDNRIEGAKRIGNMWVIPIDAQRPKDARFKISKEQ